MGCFIEKDSLLFKKQKALPLTWSSQSEKLVQSLWGQWIRPCWSTIWAAVQCCLYLVSGCAPAAAFYDCMDPTATPGSHSTGRCQKWIGIAAIPVAWLFSSALGTSPMFV